jgi:undecaprenyl-diphosphatase
LIIALTLSVMGFLLYYIDKRVRHEKDLGQIKFMDAAFIGLAQAVAVIPGISRSGATITSGLFLKFDRVSAARFSFLLSAPIIFGAATLKLRSFFSAGINAPEITAILVSATFGYLTISLLLRFIEKVSYKVFFWYRLALAVAILSVILAR